MKRILFALSILLLLTTGFSAVCPAQEVNRKDEVEAIRVELENICRSLQQFMERPDKLRNVNIEDVSEINAYADNKGDVTFLMGMVDYVRSEDEIAVVCGHELAHLSAQHIKRSIGTSILATVTSYAIGGDLGNVAGNLLYTKKSRSHEREADERGILYAWRAGYDPRAAWKFWRDLQNHYEAGNSKIERYFSTHPVYDERIENLKVLLVRYCNQDATLAYCDHILSDEDLLATFNAFESRD